MARKDNKVNMPMSTAGITQYFDDYETSLTLQPGHVIVITGIVAAIVIFLHIYGNAILGLG